MNIIVYFPFIMIIRLEHFNKFIKKIPSKVMFEDISIFQGSTPEATEEIGDDGIQDRLGSLIINLEIKFVESYEKHISTNKGEEYFEHFVFAFGDSGGNKTAQIDNNEHHHKRRFHAHCLTEQSSEIKECNRD